jgi:ribosomal protein L32
VTSHENPKRARTPRATASGTAVFVSGLPPQYRTSCALTCCGFVWEGRRVRFKMAQGSTRPNKTQEQSDKTQGFCGSCGNKLAKSHRFCPHCGAERQSSHEARVAASAPTSTRSSRAGSSTANLLLILGGIAVVAGIGGLLLADTYKPTVENAIAQGEVLSREAYNTLRVISWLFIVGGGVTAIVGLTQLSGSAGQRTTGNDGVRRLPKPTWGKAAGPTPGPARSQAAAQRPAKPKPVSTCPKCGSRFKRDDAFCGSCGTRRPAPV